MAQNVI